MLRQRRWWWYENTQAGLGSVWMLRQRSWWWYENTQAALGSVWMLWQRRWWCHNKDGLVWRVSRGPVTSPVQYTSLGEVGGSSAAHHCVALCIAKGYHIQSFMECASQAPNDSPPLAAYLVLVALLYLDAVGCSSPIARDLGDDGGDTERSHLS
ncbi:hypothetical protein P4O66_004232 [Electrophorus voltai]|uniref:Uncharacterized protein n=1 Tax=Electrophorus voltai TaxID=2609070 RepID=A0AAD9E339_9TELE|nr:hypothetical protein P4O66_004232 [Electrophorus voltai]